MSASAILLTAAGVVGVLVAAAIGAVLVLLYRTERLVESAVTRLAALPCPRCGAVIGAQAAAALGAARAEHIRKRSEEARAKGFILRIADWRFPCPACGGTLQFDPGVGRDPLTKV